MGWKFHAVTILMALSLAGLAAVIGYCAMKIFS